MFIEVFYAVFSIHALLTCKFLAFSSRNSFWINNLRYRKVQWAHIFTHNLVYLGSKTIFASLVEHAMDNIAYFNYSWHRSVEQVFKAVKACQNAWRAPTEIPFDSFLDCIFLTPLLSLLPSCSHTKLAYKHYAWKIDARNKIVQTVNFYLSIS